MDPYALQRRLTCILAADAVGYSKHMGQDEEGTIQVLAAHRAVIDGIIAFHRGRIVGTAGDSVLAEFTSAVEAVRCAVEIQDALRTRNDALPEHRRLLFRVGVNLGDVVVKDADLLGDGVNVAARLESLAEPGGICIASSVYDQITGKLDLGFQDIGEQALKNITRPVRVYRVSGARPVEHAAPEPTAPAAPAASGSGRPLVWGMLGASVALLGAAGVLWWQQARPVAPASATAAASGPSAHAAAASAAVAAAASVAPTSAASVARAPVPPAPRPEAKPRPTPAAAVPAAAVAVAPAAPTPTPTPVPVVSAQAPTPNVAPAVEPPVASAMAFDGNWAVRVECPRHEDGAMGYKLDLVAQVHNGQLHGETGTEGQPGWMLLRGVIRSDGGARLHAQGLTGDPRFAVKGVRSGSPYQYDVEATFTSHEGQGRRLQLRPCQLAFSRM